MPLLLHNLNNGVSFYHSVLSLPRSSLAHLYLFFIPIFSLYIYNHINVHIHNVNPMDLYVLTWSPYFCLYKLEKNHAFSYVYIEPVQGRWTGIITNGTLVKYVLKHQSLKVRGPELRFNSTIENLPLYLREKNNKVITVVC